MKKIYPRWRNLLILRTNPLFNFILLVLILPAFSSQAQTLIWRDEFNSPKVDEEKWTREVGGSGNGNGELQYYTAGEQNVFIGTKTNASDTGYLTIEARRENYGIAPENRQFTSGRLNTSGKFDVKYGTIEARIKLPNLQNGLWPAFWMLGSNYPSVGWPRCGEIDILEAGFKGDWQAGVANKKANATIHWHQDNYLTLVPDAHAQGWYGNASAGNDTTIAGTFFDGFHTFKMEWTPSSMKGYVDGIHYYTFNIPANDPNITEFSSSPYYIILNLAVGGSNFVGITDPAQITAPLPAQMQIDYVRVYANANTTTFASKDVKRETGTFGVFTETKTVNASLGATPQIDVWENLTASTTTSFEGTRVLSFTASTQTWFGLGIPTPTGTVRNMENFIDGTLRFHMKTTSTSVFSIGVSSTINGNAQGHTQSKTVKLDPAANQYGLVRDGQWHEVIIPISAFGNVEFRTINTMFYIVGDKPTTPVTFAIDNIYWQDGTKVTPQNGDFVLYSDTRTGAAKFNLGTDGNFNVWEATLTAQATPAAEGTNVLSFTHNNKGWFGAAFSANNVYNLTAFENPNARLVFSLKTSDTTTPFYIGMKSGTRDGEGQRWIAFEPGRTPYNFVRNGTWQTVSIPMSEFYESLNLGKVTQLFQILGTGNIANIAIDNIYFSGGLTAKPDDGNAVTNVAPTANAGADRTITLPANSVTINGSGADTDGSIASYAWTRISGPNTPTLSGANSANLTASNLIAGTYVFRLTVTDNQGATGFDEVNVVVNNANNPAPVANAGADRTITLPTNSIVINGSGTDSNGTISAYAWTRVSGPNTPTLSGANTANLTASNLIAGTYVFRLTVTDNQGATGSDDVNVVVNPATTNANLALNKTTSVSSVENAGTPGSGAVDGSTTTRWSSAFADPQWISVDLGANYNVNRVKVTWEAAYGRDYQVQISSNATSWTNLKTITGNTTLVNDHTGLSGTGRYIRIYGTVRGTPYGYSIFELEVYGGAPNAAPVANAGADRSITLPTNSVSITGSGTDSDGTISSYAWTRVSGPNTPTLSGANTATLSASGLIQGTYVFRLTVTDNGGLTASDDVNVVVNPAVTNVNLALNKATTVSSTENAGTPSSGAVDGNASTRWSSAFADPQWIYVDLGANFNVNRVKVTWEAAYGRDYQVQISSNASTWTNLKTITGNTTLVNDHTGLSGTGRYIRIYGTARGTVYGYSIFELEVYGSSAARLVIPDNSGVSVQVYPNPVASSLIIEGVEENSSVIITNTSGIKVMETKLNNRSIDVNQLSEGVYIISVSDGNRLVKKTFIKK